MNKILNKIKCLQKHPLRQRGAVLMVMLVILVTGGSAMLLSSLNSVTPRLARDNVTSSALAQAKEALIGRAITDNNRPGSLPCPDTNNDGIAENDGIADPDPACPDYIGRLPWKTLGISDLRDGSGESLWYALSPSFADSSSNKINSNTSGSLLVYDNSAASLLTPPGSEAVAIIFAPGYVVTSQQRATVANQNSASNYLDIGPDSINNASASGPFIAANKITTFNDRLMIIKTGDIISIVEKRVKKELEKAFLGYGSYPYPANFTCTSSASCVSDTASQPTCVGKIPVGNPGFTLPAWFVPNNWFDVVYYAASTSTLPLIGGGGMGGGGMGGMGLPSTGTGCFNPLIVSGTNVKALFILPGAQLNGTGRTSLISANLADYFEDNQNKVIDADYVIPSSSSNDTLHILP